MEIIHTICIEIIIFVLSFSLIMLSKMALKQKHWLNFSLLMVALVFIQLFAYYYILGPRKSVYHYATNIPKVELYEIPFKGRNYKAVLSELNKNEVENPQIYRTFKPNWLNVYKWYDYMTHPRWKLPYKNKE